MMEEESKCRNIVRECFSIPNIMSYLRFLMIPVFLYLYYHAQTPEDYLTVAGVIALSAITDFLDGFIARRFDMRTELGVLLDPLADKFTQGAIAIMFMGSIGSMTYLFILFCGKELFMLVNDIILYRKGKKFSGALWAGKVSTTVFFVTTVLLAAFPTMPVTLSDALVLLTAAFLLISFFQYGVAYKQMYAEAAAEKRERERL